MMREPTKTTVFTGLGLLSGVLPDGRQCVYHGGVVRIPKHDLPVQPKRVFEKFAEQALQGVEALRSRGDAEPAEGAPLELSGYWETETGDVLLMRRVACVEIVTH
jgi:hypothetical protein